MREKVQWLRIRGQGPYWFYGGQRSGLLSNRIFSKSIDWTFPFFDQDQELVLQALSNQEEDGLELEKISFQLLSEGVSSSSILAPGEQDLFLVQGKEAKNIGLGIQSDENFAELKAYDRYGNLLGEGRTLFLEGGQDVFVLVRNQDPLKTMIYKPALVGLSSPDDTPEKETKRLLEEQMKTKGERR